MVFRSKIDLWLPMVAFGLPIIAASIPLTHGFDVKMLPALAIIAGVIVFEGWLFSSVEYRVERDELRIAAALFRWTIPIHDIVSITPTRSPVASPALSLDRLEVRYGDRSILVSPSSAFRFIAALRAVNPAIIAPESRRS